MTIVRILEFIWVIGWGTYLCFGLRRLAQSIREDWRELKRLRSKL